MNYADDDYTLGHILRFARETGLDELTIDFVTATGRPSALLREPISEVPQRYTEMFWNMVARSGSDRALIKAATLTIRYDLNQTLSGPPVENAYVCEVSILDDRGSAYHSRFAGWWYVEKKGIWLVEKNRSRWRNLMAWFRRESR